MAELSKLGRYELRRVLGRGAMGVVYEAFDPTLGRRVAVKTILKSAALDEETERAYSERFVREAKAVGRLNHPNIVQVHDFGEENEVAYLVMEFIQGRELRSYFEAQEKFEIADSVRIMGELLDALEFAHEAGVVHRDVKPANVMLDAQRRVKLTDFGVARVQDGAHRSVAGTMVGTPAFMSPEQISGKKIDRRTDIFSAGTILYQLLTGEQPFKGDGAWTVAKKIMEDDPPPPSAVMKSVSSVYDAIVDKALAKTPAQRFASARELSAALREALAGKPQAVAAVATTQQARTETKASDTELEFWRSIQNRDDLEELELYVEQFPGGAYSQLARLKIAKLKEPLVAARKASEEQSRREAEARERAQREAQAAAEAKREAEERARREAEARAKAQREADERARREAVEKAKREADEKARREAVEKAKREAEETARHAQAAARAMPSVDEDATVATGSDQSSAPAPVPAAARKTSLVAVIALLAVGIGAFVFMSRKPAPAPVAEAPAVPMAQAPVPVPAAPPKAEVSAADIDKIKRETEERIRREYADKSAAEQAVAAKAAADKAVQEKQLALKAATEKAALDKAAADRAGAEKVAAERLLTAKSAAEMAAAEQAAEKAAAEKAAAAKAAVAQKAVAKAPGTASRLPGAGDRWVYEARPIDRPDKKSEIVVEVRSVSANGISEVMRSAGEDTLELMHGVELSMTSWGPGGFAIFSPYILAFHELRDGQNWSNIDYKKFHYCTGYTLCNLTATVVARERVTVKAGTYTAWKVVVKNNWVRPQPGRYGPMGSEEYTYWFAADIRRLVKYEARRRFGSEYLRELDVELVSYTPAGPK